MGWILFIDAQKYIVVFNVYVILLIGIIFGHAPTQPGGWKGVYAVHHTNAEKGTIMIMIVCSVCNDSLLSVMNISSAGSQMEMYWVPETRPDQELAMTCLSWTIKRLNIDI